MTVASETERADPTSTAPESRRSRIAAASIASAARAPYGSVSPIAIVAALTIGALAVVGTAYALEPRRAFAPFDLDGEWNVPAVFSASLLVAAAALLVRVRMEFSRRWAAVTFAALLAYMSIDELAQVHERLEVALNTDWQRLYAPLFLLVAVTWILLLVEMWPDRQARWLFLSSGVAWMSSQVLEYFSWNGNVHAAYYTPKVLAEEILEMIGTTLLILTFVRLHDNARGKPHRQRPRYVHDACEP